MWDCNNGTGDNRVPTLGQSVSYSTIFPRGDRGVLSPLLDNLNTIKNQNCSQSSSLALLSN